MAWLHLLCPSTLLQHNKTNILAGFVEYNSKREIIFSIFLTLEVKSYLILINFWKIVRILMISEKSDLGTHSIILVWFWFKLFLLFAFHLNGLLHPDLIYLFILIVDPIDKINFLRIESDSKLIDTLKVGDHSIPGHSVALQIGGENVHLACQWAHLKTVIKMRFLYFC